MPSEREEGLALRKKRRNKANCNLPLNGYLQGLNCDIYGDACAKQTQFRRSRKGHRGAGRTDPAYPSGTAVKVAVGQRPADEQEIEDRDKAGLVQDARPSGNSSGRHDGGGVPQRLGPVAARRARWQLPPPSPRRPRGPAPPVAPGRILKPFRPMLLGLDSRAARKASPVQEVEYSIEAIPSPRLRSDTITTRALRISRTRSLPPRDRVPVAVAARRVGAHPPTGLPRPTFPVR